MRLRAARLKLRIITAQHMGLIFTLVPGKWRDDDTLYTFEAFCMSYLKKNIYTLISNSPCSVVGFLCSSSRSLWTLSVFLSISWSGSLRAAAALCRDRRTRESTSRPDPLESLPSMAWRLSWINWPTWNSIIISKNRVIQYSQWSLANCSGKRHFTALENWVCNKSLCRMVTFRLTHSDPDSAFQPIAKTHVLYIYIIILSFVLAALPRFPAYGIPVCPRGMNMKNIGNNAVSKWAFVMLNTT